MEKSHGRLRHIRIHRYRRGNRCLSSCCRVRSEYRANVWVVLVHFRLFFSHLHPFVTSWSIVVPKLLIVCRTSNDHGTIIRRDNPRFGNVLRRTWRQGFIIESIQFLVILESMFQKVLEANSIDQDLYSSIGIQCVSKCIHLSIFVFIFFF